MKAALTAVATALLLAGCGAKLWPTYRATTDTPTRDALACAAQQADSLGYKVIYNREGLVEARRNLPLDEGGGSYRDYRKYDILLVAAERGGSQGGSALEVTAKSFTEQMTRRGPTIVDERAREEVKSSARELIGRCGGTLAET